MSETLFRATWRFLAVALLISLPSYAITYGGQLMAGQNLLDLVCFTFALCIVILNRSRIFLVFTSPRIGTSHVFSLGLLLLCKGICLSAMSAIHWRASGHLASLNDGGIRVVFRTDYAWGLACLMLASGTYEVDLSPERVKRVAFTFLAVLALVASMLFGDTFREYLWPKNPIPDFVLMERAQ